MEPSYGRHLSNRCRADNAGWLPDPALCLHLVHTLLCAVRLDLVCSRSVCTGIDTVTWTRPIRQNVLRQHDDLPVLGPALRDPASSNVGATDHEPYAI